MERGGRRARAGGSSFARGTGATLERERWRRGLEGSSDAARAREREKRGGKERMDGRGKEEERAGFSLCARTRRVDESAEKRDITLRGGDGFSRLQMENRLIGQVRIAACVSLRVGKDC